MSDDPPRFQIISGGAKRRKDDKHHLLENWLCRICEHDIGVATSLAVQTVQGPMIRGNKLMISKGVKVWVCAYCLMRGKQTRVM